MHTCAHTPFAHAHNTHSRTRAHTHIHTRTHTHTHVQNKLMKGFSRQLLIKHNFLGKAQFSDDEEGFSLEDAAKSLEADLELFLQVVSFQPRSIKVGSEVECITAQMTVRHSEVHMLSAEIITCWCT